MMTTSTPPRPRLWRFSAALSRRRPPWAGALAHYPRTPRAPPPSPPPRSRPSLVATTASSEDSGALVDRLRGALETLETLPRIETVPLWLAILIASEMVPLLPTQPLALTSGILFGAWEGGAVVLGANVTAATRLPLAGGVGRPRREDHRGRDRHRGRRVWKVPRKVLRASPRSGR